jgi:hypothetical protein
MIRTALDFIKELENYIVEREQDATYTLAMWLTLNQSYYRMATSI